MRLLTLLLIIVGIGFSACKKYNLKQPCHLSFKWKVVNNSGGSTASIAGAFLYSTSINVKGVREEGEDINLEQSMPNDKILIGSESSVAVKMDVPMGDYTSFTADVNFFDAETNDLGVNGNTVYYGSPVKFSIEWEDIQEVVFAASEKLKFKKKKDYDLDLILDASKLFEGVSQEMWNGAVVSLEQDGATIYIRETKNHPLYDKITANLSKALFIRSN